ARLATAPTEPYTLPLHDALPIFALANHRRQRRRHPHLQLGELSLRPGLALVSIGRIRDLGVFGHVAGLGMHEGAAAGIGHRLIRSEEHTSELQSRENLVCRLLLE